MDWTARDELAQRQADNRRLRREIAAERRRARGGAREKQGSGDRAAAADARSQPRARRRTAIFSRRDHVSLGQLAETLGGELGVAISGLGLGSRAEQVGSLRSGVAWSTSKVPVAMAVIARGAGESQRRDLEQALTASDNAAAMRLWTSLGGGEAAAQAAEEQLYQAGDPRTRVESHRARAGFTPFGQTRWSLLDQARFAAGLPCSSAGAAVLELMGHVVDGQRWGLGAAGVDAQFKGGWGPGSHPGLPGGYLERQMGVLTVRGRPIAVSIAARPADGAHATGIAQLTALARWVTTHAEVAGLPARARC